MDFYPLHPQPTSIDIISTAGAVPITNEKGEISMQKVKVHRYVSGKRPEYAPMSSSEEESDDDDFIEARRVAMQTAARRGDASPAIHEEESDEEDLPDDPRLRRLMNRRPGESDDEEQDDSIARIHRHRQIHEPEVLEEDEEEEREDEEERGEEEEEGGAMGVTRGRVDSSEEEEEEELSDTEIERRRNQLKVKVLSTKPPQEVEMLDKEDEGQSEDESGEETSEYEEYSDSDAEESVRLKPVFVRKKERVTLMEKEKELIKKKEAEIESKKMAEERKKQTLRMIEEEIRKEVSGGKKAEEGDLDDVNTDDENDELEYEAWKQRELKRLKRDREEREQVEKERIEIDRLHTMTEEERRTEFRTNPKLITNKAIKGKYKFMQKYYHRGAFYMDHDEDIYKRDFSEATLEDHFDKTILPRVMQVKNFGRSGRTKYTHLVDQDTTQFDSPWVSDTAQNIKFHNNQAAGMKQNFDRPSKKRK